MIGFKSVAFIATLAIGFTGSSQAALYDRGNELIYDDYLGITWTKDANLFQTLASKSGNTTAFVQHIIDANNGKVYDKPNYLDTPSYSGYRNLSLNDFDSFTGKLNWWGAQAWVNYLNQINYGNYSNWRLPAGNLENNAYGITELGYLFSQKNDTNFRFDNAQYVTNILYWFGSEIAPLNERAWLFEFYSGSYYHASKYELQHSWLVRDGDVATVPVPGAIWLFATAVLTCLIRFNIAKYQ